jgi:hypothetical protein
MMAGADRMQVGIGRVCDATEVRVALADYWPGAVVAVLACVEELLTRPSGDITVILHRNPSEFPVLLDVMPDPPDEPSVYRGQLRLAEFLSARLGCRTICDGSAHGDEPSPYWAIIWDSGEAYLADDANTVFVDGEGGPVRVVRRLEIERRA